MRQWIIDNGKLKIMVFPAEIIEIVRKAHTINSQLSIFNSQFLLGVSPINNHLRGGGVSVWGGKAFEWGEHWKKYE